MLAAMRVCCKMGDSRMCEEDDGKSRNLPGDQVVSMCSELQSRTWVIGRGQHANRIKDEG